MIFAVQRRHILVAPPDEADLGWIFDQIDLEEIWRAFGYTGPGGDRLRRALSSGNVECGVVRRDDGRHIGFSCLFPPTDELLFWEYVYAIPSALDRDAFSAIHANDAMCFYAFEWLHVQAIGGRIYPENAAARAIVKRMGFTRHESAEAARLGCEIYVLDGEQWSRRRAKLEQGEHDRPSGLGAAFLRITGPPFVPRRAASSLPRQVRA